MRRLFWVAVGAAAGVYAVRKVQKTLHAYSPGSLADRAVGTGAGLKAFAEEVREAMAQREAELREALAMSGVDALELSTDADLVDAMVRFIDMRKRHTRLAAGGSHPSMSSRLRRARTAARAVASDLRAGVA